MTRQSQAWSGDFGRAYTDRNPRNAAELDRHYRRTFGVTRSALNAEFLDGLSRNASLLEVGVNVGAQLDALSAMGFTRLHGIDVQRYALTQAKKNRGTLRLAQALGGALPFATNAFDLVYTSGVLIHISPDDLGATLGEIHRCARRYIWGWEYFAPEHTAVPYRGRDNLLWKGDFAKLYLEHFPDLRLVRQKRVKYLENDNEDAMFLLEKVF